LTYGKRFERPTEGRYSVCTAQMSCGKFVSSQVRVHTKPGRSRSTSKAPLFSCWATLMAARRALGGSAREIWRNERSRL